MMAKMSARHAELLAALKALPIGDPNTIRRVVIDIDITKDMPPVVYVEHYGDTTLIDVIRALTTVEIVREERNNG